MAKPPINDSRREDPRRRQAEELAERLNDGDGLRTLRLADHLLGLGSKSAPEATAGPPPPSDLPSTSPLPRAISIWQPRQVDDEQVFERPEVGPFGDHYAAKRRISQHKEPGTQRIVLLGESVAAGYLYAPHLTPAQVLEQRLVEISDGGCFEVVDLARTNERLATLADTLDASLQLDPDAVVIFAGNNWTLMETAEISPYATSPRQRQEYAEAWLRGGRRKDGHLDPASGARAVARLATRRLRRRVESTFGSLAPQLGQRPVTWILPESHLASWEVLQPVVWLDGDGSSRWYDLYEDACCQLREGRFEEAVVTAQAMAQMDGGSCATSPRLLFHALQGLGKLKEARQAARQHIDASAYAHLGFLASPQAGSAVQQIIRDLTTRHDWGLVDLPEVFAHHRPDGLPGDDLFVDYCHLSRDGMDLAMTETAQHLLRQLGLDGSKDCHRTKAKVAAIEVAASAEATAFIGAAVHGAHRHLGVGPRSWALTAWPLASWLEKAVTASTDALDTLEDLLAVRSAPGPEVLNPAQGRQLGRPHPLLLQHGWRWPYLDIDLLEAICQVLETHGRTPRPRLYERLIAHHGVDGSGQDLTRPPYLWQPLARLFPEVMEDSEISRRATLRGPWPWLDVCLLTAAQDVELEITARLPPIAGRPRRGDLELLLDGQSLGFFPLKERWTTHRCIVPAAQLDNVVHRLRLRWPSLPACGDDAMEDATARLDIGRVADLHPIFGEIYSLWAHPVSRNF